jgi:3-oxoacyl-[acyl-carrier protein] reductase
MSYPNTLGSKVALVVGGSGGIGAAASRLLAEAGAQVAVTYRPDGQGEAAAADLVRALPGASIWRSPLTLHRVRH